MAKDIFEHNKKRVEEQNKRYPLMEYFLDRKPLEKCSPECQRQVADIGNNTTGKVGE
jgi:hypothetical protein